MEPLRGIFVVIIDGVEKTFTTFEEIPEVIDNVVRFEPEDPGPDCGDYERSERNLYGYVKFQELMERETR